MVAEDKFEVQERRLAMKRDFEKELAPLQFSSAFGTDGPGMPGDGAKSSLW